MATTMMIIHLRPSRGARDKSEGPFSAGDGTAHRQPPTRLTQVAQSIDNAVIASMTRWLSLI
jgi:hypothetical protein